MWRHVRPIGADMGPCRMALQKPVPHATWTLSQVHLESNDGYKRGQAQRRHGERAGGYRP